MKTRKIELKWALIFVATTLLWLWIEKILGFHGPRIAQHPIITNFFLIPAILIYVLALNDKKKNFYDGYISYKESLLSGMIISIIVALFVPVTQSVISLLISPDYFDNAINYSVKSGNVTQEEAEGYFNLQTYIIQGMIATPIIGTVTTLIISIFIKKKKAEA